MLVCMIRSTDEQKTTLRGRKEKKEAKLGLNHSVPTDYVWECRFTKEILVGHDQLVSLSMEQV